MIKKVFKILAVFIIGTIGGIFADQILWPYFIERPLFYEYRLERVPVNLIETNEITIQENIALQKAIEKVGNTIIGVQSKTKQGIILEGSGLILTSDGIVVTLADLVPQGSDLSFFWEGEKVPFQVLKRDLQNNLALIKIEKSNLPTAGFAGLDKITLGQRVFLLGIVFEESSPQKITNEGIVKIFSKNAIRTNIFEKNILNGSTLFDIEGNVLGLNVIDKEGKVSAIPIGTIQGFAGF